MDDRFSIVENPAIKSTENIPEIFKQGYFRDQHYYRPLVNLSFLAEYQLFRLNAFFYNLDNLLLHIANALLVLCLVTLLTGQMQAGFWVGLLFAIHPIQWEAVCNIPGRAILLSAFFSLNAFIFFLLSLRKDWYALPLSLLSFALALLCKESAGVLPGVIFMYVLATTNKLLRSKVMTVMPYAVVMGAYILLRHQLGITKMAQAHDVQTTLLGFLTFLRSVITDLRLFVWPLDLHFDRSQPFLADFAALPLQMTVLFWLMAGVLLYHWRGQIKPWVFFLIAWFGLELLPVSQLVTSIGVQQGRISTAEHFLYVAAVPVFIGVVQGVQWLYRRNSQQKWVSPSVFKIGIGLWLLFFVLMSVAQSFYASSEFAMLKRSLMIEPHNARLQASMGLQYVFREDFKEAQKYFQAAVNEEPFNAKYLISLGTSLCQQDRWIECMGQYVSLDQPGEYNEMLVKKEQMTMVHIEADLAAGKTLDDQGWFIIGVYYAKIGRMPEAIDAFDKAIEINPNHAGALLNLGSLQEAKQDWPKAQAAYEQMLKIPTLTVFQENFARQHLNQVMTR